MDKKEEDPLHIAKTVILKFIEDVRPNVTDRQTIEDFKRFKELLEDLV